MAFPFLQEAPVQRLIMACNVEAVLVEHVEQITSAYASLGTREVHVMGEVTRNPSFLVHNLNCLLPGIHSDFEGCRYFILPACL